MQENTKLFELFVEIKKYCLEKRSYEIYVNLPINKQDEGLYPLDNSIDSLKLAFESHTGLNESCDREKIQALKVYIEESLDADPMLYSKIVDSSQNKQRYVKEEAMNDKYKSLFIEEVFSGAIENAVRLAMNKKQLRNKTKYIPNLIHLDNLSLSLLNNRAKYLTHQALNNQYRKRLFNKFSTFLTQKEIRSLSRYMSDEVYLRTLFPDLYNNIDEAAWKNRLDKNALRRRKKLEQRINELPTYETSENRSKLELFWENL